MRKLTFVLILLLAVPSYAQEVREYSDEELTQYATVIFWSEQEKGELTKKYNRWIKESEHLGVPRFLELKNTSGDSIRLREIEATQLELKEFSSITNKYDSIAASFIDLFKSKINNDVGAGLFNSLKADLANVPELKERYQKIYDRLQTKSGQLEEEN